MKIVTGFITKKQWVVNAKGKRITPKYARVKLTNYGSLVIVEGYDNYAKAKIKPKETWVFSTRTARRFLANDIKEHRLVVNGIVTLYFCNSWYFYDQQGKYLEGGIKQFFKCNGQPYIAAQMGDTWYFFNKDMKIVSDNYLHIENFDKFGYAAVVGSLSQKRFSRSF